KQKDLAAFRLFFWVPCGVGAESKMAGRGRGRGRGFSFDIASIGFGRGSEALPTATLQPPPTFPPLEKRPLPLRMSEADDYMLVLKEEFKLIMNASPYYIKPDIVNRDIERYSDRFKEKHQNESTMNWTPDWSYIPAELKIKTKTSKSRRHNPLKPNGRRKLDASAPDIDFEKLEKADETENEGGTEKTTQENKPTEGKGDDGSDDPDEEDEYDEEEQEEVTFYS
ncbi:hypothetical protein QZH41_014901, partial [Actinostola sp. cb2023]